MPLPKRKTSHARTSQRRANNWKLPIPSVVDCPRCRAPRLPHHVCRACGFYENRMVIEVGKKKGDETEQAAGGEERE